MPNPNLLMSEETTDDDVVEPKGPTFKIFTGALKAFEKPDDTRKYLRCTASSTAKDLHGDEMTAECVQGMAPQAKSKSMTIFLNHSYKWPEDIFGKTTDAAIISRSQDADGNAIYDLDLEIQLNESNPRALEAYSAIRDQGIKAGVSIGAMIDDYEFIDEEAGFWGGLRIKWVDLLEASVVGIPANQRSWVVNALKALGAPKGVIHKAIGLGDPTVKKTAEQPKAAPVAPAEPIVTKKVESRYHLNGKDITNQLDVTQTETTVAPNADGTIQADFGQGFKSVTVKDGNTAADTGSTTPIEVEDSAAPPEGEIPDESDKSADAADPADDEATEGSASPVDVETAVASLKASGVGGELLDVVLGMLEGATEEVVSLRTALATATTERDQARQEVLEAAEIVETIARTPLGRKTRFQGSVTTFRQRFGGMYDEGFLKLLDEGEPESE